MSHTVFITGASRGLGLELTRQFLDADSRVFAAAREPKSDTLQSLKSAHRSQLQLLSLDVTDNDQILKAAATLAKQPLNVLINNAGLFLENPFVGGPSENNISTVNTDRWLTVFRVNTIAPLMLTRALRPNLKAGDRGTVAMISSLMGSLTNNHSGGAYSYRSSKAALNATTVSLANDLVDDGIRVVALHPGWLQTDMGGSDAPLDVETSAKGLIAIMRNLEIEQSGCFFDHTGLSIAW